MSWNEYNGKAWRAAFRERIPVIVLGTISISLMIGFVILLANQSGDESTGTASDTDVHATGSPNTSDRDSSGLDHPEPTAEHEKRAKEGAVNFVRAWARPHLPQQQWLAGIEPYVAPYSLVRYESVDPQRVPATAVTGEPEIQQIEVLSSIVHVPTDAGGMRVVLDNEAKALYIEPVDDLPQRR